MIPIIIIIIWTLFYLFYLSDIEYNQNYERTKCESSLERTVFDALIQKGYIVRTQVPCGRYRIDVALLRYKIAIECDGEYWHSSPEAKKNDRKKTYFLKKNGWKVCRFKGKTIQNDINYVLKCIERRIL